LTFFRPTFGSTVGVGVIVGVDVDVDVIGDGDGDGDVFTAGGVAFAFAGATTGSVFAAAGATGSVFRPDNQKNAAATAITSPTTTYGNDPLDVGSGGRCSLLKFSGSAGIVGSMANFCLSVFSGSRVIAHRLPATRRLGAINARLVYKSEKAASGNEQLDGSPSWAVPAAGARRQPARAHHAVLELRRISDEVAVRGEAEVAAAIGKLIEAKRAGDAAVAELQAHGGDGTELVARLHSAGSARRGLTIGRSGARFI
jgi:hypothetical protein